MPKFIIVEREVSFRKIEVEARNEEEAVDLYIEEGGRFIDEECVDCEIISVKASAEATNA